MRATDLRRSRFSNLFRDSTNTELTTSSDLMFCGYPWRPFGSYLPVTLSLRGRWSLTWVTLWELDGGARTVKAMSSDAALSQRVRGEHERMSRNPSCEGQTHVKRVRFAEPPAEHTSCSVRVIFVVVVASKSKLAARKSRMKVTRTLDQRRLKLADPPVVLRDAPVSADVTLSSAASEL